MDTAQWPQMVVKPIEEIVVTSNNNNNTSSKHGGGGGVVERKARPQKESALNCPRCHSTNTKFCYYNNYSLTQPRYFCKTCRRYWTEGGSLRNIPVGGGSRKNKRPTSSSCSSPSLPNNKNNLASDLVLTHTQPNNNCALNPNMNHQAAGQDLNLAFPDFTNISELVQQNNNNMSSASASSSSSTITTTSTATASSTTCQLSALELLTSSTSLRGLNSSFMPLMPADPNTVYNTCGIPPPQDFKPTLNFCLDGISGSFQDSASGRLLFPLEDLKQQVSSTSTSTILEHHHHQQININKGDSTGYWTGMLGGSGSW